MNLWKDTQNFEQWAEKQIRLGQVEIVKLLLPVMSPVYAEKVRAIWIRVNEELKREPGEDDGKTTENA